MNKQIFLALSALITTAAFANDAKVSKFPVIKDYPDVSWMFGGKYKPESFYGHHTSLLNNKEKEDRTLFARHSLDLDFDFLYGLQTFGHTAAEFKFTLRNKGVWGDPGSIARTTDTETKTVDAVERPHNHSIPRHILWIREGWLEFSLRDALGFNFTNDHTFTIGSFPFELGRGIALGDAYAVGPETLGFYSDGSVDQYAFGAKFSGEILKDKLFYDLYAAILENKTASTKQTGANIRGQEFGRTNCPQRGFGRMDTLFAGRLFWHVFDYDSIGHLVVEPYWLYNNDAEQKVEFTADARSELGTVGFAVEFEQDRFEFGCDFAKNFGSQTVRGWDRNVVQEASQLVVEAGIPVRAPLVFQNSHVVDAVGDKVPHDQSSAWGKAIQNAINLQSLESKDQNGQKIATVVNPDNNAESINLFNASNRFRDQYKNTYHGFMFVCDAAVNFLNKDLQWAVTAGFASGDRNPNEELIDGTYDGFISLQERYAGKRVRNAFLFGRAKRPLAAPTSAEAPNRFAKTISGFNDIRFVGTGIKWEPKNSKRKYMIHPNFISYWKSADTPKFDPITKQDIKGSCARNHLGFEASLFSHVYLFDNLKLFGVAAVFVPGGHYTDIKGTPLNSAQFKALDRLDRTGFEEADIPNLSDNVAFTVNIGLEFKF